MSHHSYLYTRSRNSSGEKRCKYVTIALRPDELGFLKLFVLFRITTVSACSGVFVWVRIGDSCHRLQGADGENGGTGVEIRLVDGFRPAEDHYLRSDVRSTDDGKRRIVSSRLNRHGRHVSAAIVSWNQYLGMT